MDRPNTSCNVHVNDPEFSDRVRRLMDDESNDGSSEVESDVVDDSDADPDFVLPDEPDIENREEIHTDSGDDDNDDEQLLEDELDVSLPLPELIDLPEYFFGRLKKNENGPAYPWATKEPTTNVRTPARNLVVGGLPGLKAPARALGNNPNKLDVWKLLFDDDMVQIVVSHTNLKLGQTRLSLGPTTNKSTYRDTDAVEVNALLGIMLLTSIFKSNDEPMSSLFSKGTTSRPIFVGAMNGKRFKALLAALRFDDHTTRDIRKQNDKAAAVSELFNKGISNSQTMYSLGVNVTIDEMLVPFRGRCAFRMYLPNKPHKYGIKVMCLADAKTSYLYNAYIYTGKDSDGIGLTADEKKFGKPTQSVIRLCKPIEKTNRNITADNWFTSMDTLEEMGKRGLTYVGTLRKDKNLIPKEFLPNKERPVKSSLYGFNGHTTLLSYVPKKNRAVVLASTMHNRIEMDIEKQKPEIICYYNSTKCGVDLLDMKCAIYSANRRTRRWPLAIMYRLVSVLSINSFILYLCYSQSPDTTRFAFVEALGLQLIAPHMKRRLETPNLRRDVKEIICKTLGNEEQPMGIQEIPCDKMQKRKTCAKCPSAKERKTAYMCIKCKIPICLECSRKVCTVCALDCVG